MTDRRTRIATALVAVLLAIPVVTPAQSGGEVALRAAMETETVKGDLRAAIEQYKQIAAGRDRALAAKALLRMAECYQKLGDSEARAVYERVIREYADQSEAVTLARARLGATAPVSTTKGDRAVWTGPYVDLFGQVSPDGRFITFTDWFRSNNLMVRDVALGTHVALTNNSSFVDNPSAAYQGEAQWSAISKDGKRVAYGWFDNTADGRQIRITTLDAVGTPKYRQLLAFKADEVRFCGAYDWSPDGKWIAMVIARADGTTQIGLAAVADGTLRVMKTTGWQGPERVFFSPDGRYLAYDLPATDTSDTREVFVLATDGSREIPVVVHPAEDRLMGWSPDGALILFSSDRTGSTGLWGQPFANERVQGSPELLRPDIGASSVSLGLTRSGALYLYRRGGNRDLRIAPIDLTTGRLSAPPRQFGQGFLLAPVTPDWSPDGQQLVYQACGGDCLAIRSVETGQVRQLPRMLLYPRNPKVVARRSVVDRRGARHAGAEWTLSARRANRRDHVDTGRATVQLSSSLVTRWEEGPLPDPSRRHRGA